MSLFRCQGVLHPGISIWGGLLGLLVLGCVLGIGTLEGGFGACGIGNGRLWKSLCLDWVFDWYGQGWRHRDSEILRFPMPFVVI